MDTTKDLSSGNNQVTEFEPIYGEPVESGLSFSLEVITPDVAKQMLMRNVSNRTLRPAHVAKIAESMRRGKFDLTSATISFYTDGTLADGQHRLSAVIRSGCEVPMIVVRGMEHTIHLDTGLKRNAIDAAIINSPELQWLKYNRAARPVVRLIYQEWKDKNLSIDEGINDYLVKYKLAFESIKDWYKPESGATGLNTTGVKTAFVTALIDGADQGRLKNAAIILAKNIPVIDGETYEPCTQILLTLRAALTAGNQNRSGALYQHNSLYMTAGALSAYLNGKSVNRLDIPTKYPFRIYNVAGDIIYDPN